MNKLIELLKRWAELEPDKCQATSEGVFYGVGGVQFNHWSSYTNLGIDEARVQYEVQQAIEARGWYFAIQPSPSQYKAVVYKSLTEGSDHYFISSSIAEALLEAYLAAIEATAGVAG